jgi:ABC-type branched-subunit amino acid transport system substrate-binding protein
MGWDNAYGKEPLNGGLQYGEKIGLKVLPPEYFPPGSLDHSVYLNRLASGGANYIYVGGIDPNPSNALRDAYKLGLTKTIQFCGDFYGPDDQVGVKLHPEATEGSIKVMWCICGEDGRAHPWAQLYPKYRNKPVSEMSAYYVTGMLWSFKFEKALKKALDAVGYDKLNGAAMYEAFQQLTGMEQEGAQGPIAYSKTQRRGSMEYRIYQVKNGKNIRITDWVKAPDAVSLGKW